MLSHSPFFVEEPQKVPQKDIALTLSFAVI